MMPDREPKKNTRRSFLGKLFRGTIATAVLVACGDLTPFSPSPNTETPPTPSGLSTEAPTTLPTAIPTAENTPVPPTPQVTPERPDASGGLYTPDQMVAIEGGKFSDQEQILADWTKYVWTQGGNRAFDPETTRLNYTYIFDPNDPVSAGVGLVSLDYPGVVMTVPLDTQGNPLPTPTTKLTTADIPERMGPTMMSIQMDETTAKKIDPINYPQLKDSVLGWSNGGWVRMISGKVTADIGEKGTWKTEIDYNQAFFDPQSEADFPRVIEAPPLDDPNRSTWEDNCLAAVDAKLPDYQGPFIESAANGGFDPGNGNFEFQDTIVQPIASYKYFWTAPDGTEETIITKIFPIRDTASGKRGTISITYPPPGTDGEILPFSTWYGDFGEYGTATVKAPLYLVTGRIGLPVGGMLFSNEFLPADNTMGLHYLREFGTGKGIDPNLAKQHYVFAGY